MRHDTPQSSMFSAIEWEADILTVHMRNGRSYTYEAVPFSTFVQFKTAESIGKFYNTQIKGQYAAVNPQ